MAKVGYPEGSVSKADPMRARPRQGRHDRRSAGSDCAVGSERQPAYAAAVVCHEERRAVRRQREVARVFAHRWHFAEYPGASSADIERADTSAAGPTLLNDAVEDSRIRTGT